MFGIMVLFIYKLKQNGVAGDLLDTFTNFLKERKQRVILNGQHSTWTNVEAGVLQGSILGPLLFLIHINDLPEKLVSNPKLFADDTSLFPVIRNKQLSAQNLNEDLNKINHWAFQWKMSFNPLSAKFIKWSNTLKQIVGNLPTICLSVFDHFSGLAFKGLILIPVKKPRK